MAPRRRAPRRASSRPSPAPTRSSSRRRTRSSPSDRSSPSPASATRCARAGRGRVAVSPIVGGEALRGPAADMLRTLGHEVSPAGVAALYAGLVDVMVIDDVDGAHADAHPRARHRDGDDRHDHARRVRQAPSRARHAGGRRRRAPMTIEVIPVQFEAEIAAGARPRRHGHRRFPGPSRRRRRRAHPQGGEQGGGARRRPRRRRPLDARRRARRDPLRSAPRRAHPRGEQRGPASARTAAHRGHHVTGSSAPTLASTGRTPREPALSSSCPATPTRRPPRCARISRPAQDTGWR